MNFRNSLILVQALVLGVGIIGASAEEFATRFFYARQGLETQEITPTTPVADLANLFDPSQPLKIIIHGWFETSKSYSAELLKTERQNMFYENKKQETTEIGYMLTPVNIVVVDWSVYSMNVQYPNSLSSVPLASADVANLVDALVAANVTSKPQVHMVGYDLGAHVAGSAGSFMSPRPGRITGLDAAGPGYGNGGLDNWLDKNDAVFVDTIHTCGGGYLGVDGEYGHVDFYPNKGTVPQPTCEDTTTEIACSHLEAIRFFFNSITNPQLYRATIADSWNAFISSRCEITSPAYMGDSVSLSTPPGKYYLLTDRRLCIS